MTRYRSRVVEIEAIEWDGDNIAEIRRFMAPSEPHCSAGFTDIDQVIGIQTLEGQMTARVGDYIIKGTEGEFYPCKPSVFQRKYSDAPVGETSDGYHTFNELYEHRIQLWITLCRELWVSRENVEQLAWRSKLHSDGSSLEGWFVLGVGHNTQITYHVPLERWDDCGFAATLERAPTFDGHTSADVLQRLKTL